MKVRILLVSLLFIATAEFAKAVEIECQYVLMVIGMISATCIHAVEP